MTPSQSTDIWFSLFWHTMPLIIECGNYSVTLPEEAQEPLSDSMTDFRRALVLLYECRGDRTVRYLDVRDRPVIRIDIYNGGYTKGEFTRSYNFPITNELLMKLQAEKLVSKIPKRDYVVEMRLQLNASGIERLFQECLLYNEERSESTPI